MLTASDPNSYCRSIRLYLTAFLSIAAIVYRMSCKIALTQGMRLMGVVEISHCKCICLLQVSTIAWGTFNLRIRDLQYRWKLKE